jgi:hypothetical protein
MSAARLIIKYRVFGSLLCDNGIVGGGSAEKTKARASNNIQPTIKWTAQPILVKQRTKNQKKGDAAAAI